MTYETSMIDSFEAQIYFIAISAHSSYKERGKCEQLAKLDE